MRQPGDIAAGRRETPRIDFGWIMQAWGMVRAEMGVWAGASALFLLLSLSLSAACNAVDGEMASTLAVIRGGWAAVGTFTPHYSHSQIALQWLLDALCAGVDMVMTGGLYRMARRQMRGEPIRVTGLFSVADTAGPLLVVGALPAMLTNAVNLLPNASLYEWLLTLPLPSLILFAPLLVLEHQLPPLTAFARSIDLLRRQWLRAIGFYFLVTLASGAGFFFCMIGLIVTLPINVLAVSLAYHAFVDSSSPEPWAPDYGVPQEGVWPPPPMIAPPTRQD